MKYIKKVFQALFDHQLYAKLSKCIIIIKNLEFYIHVVGNSTVKLIIFKIKIIAKWLFPKIVHEVQQFL